MFPKTALVTGAKGMLGTDLCHAFSMQGYTIICTDLETLDVADRDQVFQAVRQLHPSMIVHLAALTDVDGCERDPEQTMRVNAEGTRHLGEAARETGAKMVYISTSGVFSGEKATPYIEMDRPCPVNVYGRSKLMGEKYLLEVLPEALILRAGWMFGGEKADKKFVAKILQKASEETELKVVSDTYGSPTYTHDLSQAVIALLEAGVSGIYHTANEGVCSRFEFAGKVLEYAGITNCRLVPISHEEWRLPARRPLMEGITNYRLHQEGRTLFPPWEDSLHRYLLRYLF